MYVMMTVLVLIFWFGGVITGMASSIFLLGLEETYILQPLRYVRAEIKGRSIRVFSYLIMSSKRTFRFLSFLGSQNTRTVSEQ